MNRADEFVQLFNQLTQLLRRKTKLRHGTPFHELVRETARSNPAVRRSESVLRDFAELRNAIVHYRDYPEKYCAEPTEASLARFRRLVGLLGAPGRLIPAHRKDVRVFRPDEPFVDVLTFMDEMDFSQVVALRDGEHVLLTAEGIAEWLRAQAGQERLDLREYTVGDVLESERGEKSAVLSRNHTVYDAIDLFSPERRNGHPRIYAVLITHSGKRHERPLGLVTVWDLLEDAGEMV